MERPTVVDFYLDYFSVDRKTSQTVREFLPFTLSQTRVPLVFSKWDDTLVVVRGRVSLRDWPTAPLLVKTLLVI